MKFNQRNTNRKFPKNSKKRNPYIFEYGFHLTLKDKLEYTLNHGFKLKKAREEDILSIVYNNYLPIYLLVAPSINNREYSYGLKEYLTNFYKTHFIIKIDVRNLNQLPDMPSLLESNRSIFMEHHFSDDNDLGLFIEGSRTTPMFSPLIDKWILKYKGKIPLGEFRTNDSLIKDCILTTNTFCIAEDIPAENIVDIYDFK